MREKALLLRLAGLTYTQIGIQLGVSHQRIQQLLSPPRAVRSFIVERANGKCQKCNLQVGKSGHVHHLNSLDGDHFDDVSNLELLCVTCHRYAHVKSAPPFLPSIKDFTPERVQLIRFRLQLSREAFAEKLGVSEGSIKHWEAGHHRPKFGRTIGALLEAEREAERQEAK